MVILFGSCYSYYKNLPVSDRLVDSLPPDENISSTYRNILDDIITGGFHTDLLIACFTAANWYRLVLFLDVNQYFGPTLVMIYKMTVTILKFMGLWLLITLVFASIAAQTFTQISEFATFGQSVLTLIGETLGNFDWTLYDDVEQ